MTKLKDFKSKEKFLHDDKLFYPGIGDPNLKPILTEKINLVSDDFKKLADKGNSTAQNMLGACYSAGLNVEKDDVKAFEWQKKSAQQGNPAGELSLGNCYYFGKGVETNKEEGIKLIQKAANQGYEPATGVLERLEQLEKK